MKPSFQTVSNVMIAIASLTAYAMLLFIFCGIPISILIGVFF